MSEFSVKQILAVMPLHPTTTPPPLHPSTLTSSSSIMTAPSRPAGTAAVLWCRVRLRAAFRLVAFLCVSDPPAVHPAGGCGFVYVVQSLRVQREEEEEEVELAK